jgi:voltage-gated sodium channel
MTTTVSAAEIRFEHAVTAVIVANSVVMLASLVDHSHAELLEQVDVVCLWFFAAELSVRLAMARLGFFHSLWNTVDLVVVVVALLPVAGGGIAVLRLARLARTGHLLRHVAHLRLARLVPGWRSLGSLRRAEMRQAITTPPWRMEV